MFRMWLLIGLLVLPAGCQLEVSFDEGRYYCGDNLSSCPSGQSCVAKYCRLNGPGPEDPDAAVDEADGAPGAIDAQVLDAAPGDPDAPPPIDAAPAQPDATPPCVAGNLADDFATAAVSSIWSPFDGAAASLAETGGRLVITLPSNTAGENFAGYETAVVDARGQRVEAELAVAPSTGANGAQAFFKIELATDYTVNALFLIEGGVFYVEVDTQPVVSMTYSPTAHRHMAIEEQGGQVTFFTSSDGVAWTQRASLPASFDFAQARVVLGAGTWKSQTSPGKAEWERLGSGPSTDCRGVPAP